MDGYVTIETKLDTKSFDKQISEVEYQIKQIEYELSHAKELNLDERTVKEYTLQVEKLNNKLVDLRKKQDDVNKEMNQFNLDGLGNSIKKITKNVIKWGLAIFSIRSAYMGVRRAVSIVSQYNEELANKIKYISYAFGMLLEPVIVKIVDLVYLLMSYIDYIAQKWFKLNGSIFKSAKSMQKANQSANQLRKTLAGFDEMNKLGDNVASSDSIVPELTAINDANAPNWINWIAKNKDTVLAIISAITGALIMLKLTGLNPILTILGAILGMETYELIKNILAMISDPSWKNFGGILESLGVIISVITGMLMVIGVASGPIGWIIIAVGLLISGIGKLIKKLNTNKAKIKDLQKANEDLKEAKENLYKSTNDYTQAVKDEEEAHKKLLETQKETGYVGEELYRLVDSGKATYKNFNEQQRKVYDAYVNEQIAIGNVKTAKEKLEEATKEEITASLEQQLANAKETDSYDKLKESVTDAWNSGKISAGEARDYISRAMADMDKESKQTFMEDLPMQIKSGLDPQKYDSFATKFKNWWNKLIKGLDTTIEITGVAKGGGGSGSYGGGGSGGGRAKGGIFYPSKLPKLAVGGIINQPGRGVPYHGAYIGERGAEAVVPLTDSQQMALLGETIGKYVTINATIPVYAYNRQVDRQIKVIRAEDNFAGNR